MKFSCELYLRYTVVISSDLACFMLLVETSWASIQFVFEVVNTLYVQAGIYN